MIGKRSPVVWIALTIVSLALGYILGISRSGTVAEEIKIDNIDPKQIPPGSVGPAAKPAIVIYVDSGMKGKIKSAEHMSELHKVMAEKGWTFADFEPYIENGDLQGFWVTYVAEGGK